MQENTKRKLILWLIPLLIILFIFGPTILQAIKTPSPSVDGENKTTEQKKEDNDSTTKDTDTENKDGSTASSSDSSESESKQDDSTTSTSSASISTEVDEHLKKPKLELSTRQIVNLKKGAKVEYLNYVKATDSKGNDATVNVQHTDIDENYTDTTQGITYTFIDPNTNEVLTDTLLVKCK